MTSPESPYGPATATAPPTPAPEAPSRRRGITSLALSLIPIVLTLVLIVLLVIVGANDDTGWAILGWGIFGAYILIPVSFVLGAVALGLGISAARTNRGRGAGIAGAIIGGLILLYELLVILNFVFTTF